MARFYRTSKMFCCSLELTTPYLMLFFHFQLICLPLLTLEMVRGMLKSFPPCSLKPYGAGPFRVTVYVLIFCLMSALLLLTAPSVGALSPPYASLLVILPVPVLSPLVAAGFSTARYWLHSRPSSSESSSQDKRHGGRWWWWWVGGWVRCCEPLRHTHIHPHAHTHTHR